MDKAKVRKMVGNVEVEAVFEPSGIVNFWEICRGKQGRACYDRNTRTWQKVYLEFGAQFKAQLLKSFEIA